nr:hypothetical protein [Bryobacter aggregatus]
MRSALTPDLPPWSIHKHNAGQVFEAMVHVTPAEEQDRAQLDILAEQVQEVTRDSIELAWLTKAAPDPPASAEFNWM